MAGDIRYATLFGALNTGAAATTDFIKADFGTVKAAKWTLTYDASDDANSATEYKVCHGFTDFTNQRYITAQSEDASAKEDADARKGVIDGYFLLTVGGGDDGHGDVTAIADGVRFTNQALFSRAVLVEITLFGGADLVVDCGSHVLTNRTPDVSTNVQNTGIDQDIVFFICVDIAGEDSASTGVNNSVGVATTGREASQAIVNRCQSFTVDHNAAAGDPVGAVRNDRCLSVISEAGAPDWGIELTAADGTTFTTTIRDADPGAGMEVYYFALGFAAASPRHKSEIGTIDSPVVAGNWSKTGLGFTPGYVELGVSRLPAENTIANDATAGSVGTSYNTGAGEEACHSFYDEFGAPTINTNNCFRSRAIYLFEDDGATIAYDLSHLSFESGGWTYSQIGTPSATASKWLFVTIEATAAPVTTGAGAQTLPSLNQAGVGVQEFIGLGAQTLPPLSQDGIGVIQPSGVGAQTLAALVQAGVGVEVFTGTGAQILAALTQAAAAVEIFIATAVQTLAALTQAGVGVMQPSGAAAQTLAALVQAAVAVEIFVATAVQTLAALTQAGVGLMQPSGAAAQALAALIQSASGTHTETVTSTGAQTLAALLQAAVGVMQPSGAGAQTVAALVQAGAAVEIFVAAVVQTLAALTQSGVGVMQPSGAGAQTLAALVQAGAAVEIFVATAVQILAALTQAGVAVMQPSGAGAQVLAALVQAGAAVEIFVATGVQLLAALTQAGLGVLIFTATGAQTLAALIQAGVGVYTGPSADFPGSVVLTIVAGPDVVPSQSGAGVTLSNNP